MRKEKKGILCVEDPSRPVDAKLADETTDASKAFYVNGCDSEIVFIDQYGEEISNDGEEGLFGEFWEANEEGFVIGGSTVYYGICLFENGQKELIGAYEKIGGTDLVGVKFEVEEEADYEKASIGIVSYQGQVTEDGLSEIGAGQWSPVGDTAYVGTVSRTVTYTFTPSDVSDSPTLTYYDADAAASEGLGSAGWYFSGTITGTISMYVNGTFDSYVVENSGTCAMTAVLVSVLLTDPNGGEVDVNDAPAGSTEYTANFTLSGNIASCSEVEYSTYAWSIDLTASGTGSGESSIGDIFYNGGSGQTVSLVQE